MSYSGLGRDGFELFWVNPPNLYISHTADQLIMVSKCFHVFLISSAKFIEYIVAGNRFVAQK